MLPSALQVTELLLSEFGGVSLAKVIEPSEKPHPRGQHYTTASDVLRYTYPLDGGQA
jgi:hypothetical protein